ncbi:MAG: threonine synthase, partial [Pseudomonadota bacterium]
MKYVSTRGQAPALDFEGVLLAGLASDGGLYVPEAWPQIGAADIARFGSCSYADVAEHVIAPFVGEAIPPAELRRIISSAYASFRHRAVAPLLQIGPAEWVLELFHGPTLAFKDVAMQLLGGLFDYVLKKREERVTIVGATSGDTGSAAIE